MKAISVSDYSKTHQSEDTILIDVRSPEEFKFCNIGGVNIPLSELSERVSEIPTNKKVFCLCHHGVRSQHACAILTSLGYHDVTNIIGGIEDWSIQIDPTIDRY